MVSLGFLHITLSFERLEGIKYSNTVVHGECTQGYISMCRNDSTYIFHRITMIHVVSRDVSPLKLVRKPYIISVPNIHKDLYPFQYTRHTTLPAAYVHK
jgi:hypothetical protein